jgi:hypothetical protein
MPKPRRILERFQEKLQTFPVRKRDQIKVQRIGAAFLVVGSRDARTSSGDEDVNHGGPTRPICRSQKNAHLREPFCPRQASLQQNEQGAEMLYRKNVFAWEQVVRLLAGAAMVGGGLWGLPGWPGYLLAAAGLYTALTGVFGYCPACAMVGRKPIDEP